MRTTRRRLTAALATTAAAALTVLGGAAPAQAIPSLAQSCATDVTTVAGGSGWHEMSAPIWVHNPAWRRTIITVSADVDVDHGARVTVAFRIDPTGFRQNPGARYFATPTGSMQTRNAMVVMPVGKGWHRVYVFFAVAGSSSTSATIGGRCMTVEGNTE